MSIFASEFKSSRRRDRCVEVIGHAIGRLWQAGSVGDGEFVGIIDWVGGLFEVISGGGLEDFVEEGGELADLLSVDEAVVAADIQGGEGAWDDFAVDDGGLHRSRAEGDAGEGAGGGEEAGFVGDEVGGTGEAQVVDEDRGSAELAVDIVHLQAFNIIADPDEHT